MYLPTWEPEELTTVATSIYGFGISDESELVHRYQRYDGIPRSIFPSEANNTEDALSRSLSVTDIQYVLHEVGASVIDHKKVSGAVLHFVPDDTLRKCSFQWEVPRL